MIGLYFPATLRDILHTSMVWYCLFVLKVPFNTKQTNKQTTEVIVVLVVVLHWLIFRQTARVHYLFLLIRHWCWCPALLLVRMWPNSPCFIALRQIICPCGVLSCKTSICREQHVTDHTVVLCPWTEFHGIHDEQSLHEACDGRQSNPLWLQHWLPKISKLIDCID